MIKRFSYFLHFRSTPSDRPGLGSFRESGPPEKNNRQSPEKEKRNSPNGRNGGNGPQEPRRINRSMRSLALWVVLLLVVLFVYQMFRPGQSSETEITYSQFMREVESGNISSAVIVEKKVKGIFLQPVLISRSEGLPQKEIDAFLVWLPAADPDLSETIWSYNRSTAIHSEPEGTNWFSVLISWLPMLLILGFWIFIVRQMQTGGNKAFSFGKSKARLLTADRPKITFDDVAGAVEAKEELREIIDFLRKPEKFQRLGGKIPKGALLLGAPGTGKTLLAKAVAGEADVPFFSMSGSDFVEMFVGVGASRVRDLFDQGKKNAPCIIFIDEIDAVGRHRGAGLGGGHDEREQTLNQLLVEMDGFESKEGVILIAATNRPDVLDPALLRPGRFDRQIVVDMPDVKGREGILKVHTRKIRLADDISLNVLARGTPGLSGADLANLVNEAALLAARRNRDSVVMVDFEDAKDKVMMGMERKSLLLTDEDKKGTAYHEAGHALLAGLLPHADPLHKVSIIPRGQALGLTHLLPMDEKKKWSSKYCLDVIALTMGGRAAEIIIFDELTTGARDDIEKASSLARKMVCEWGMSKKLGPLSFGKKEEQIFLGREIARHRDYSERTAETIDDEVREIVETQFSRAMTLLTENMDKLELVAAALLEREVLDGKDLERIMRGEDLEPLIPPVKPEATEVPQEATNGKQEKVDVSAALPDETKEEDDSSPSDPQKP